MLLGGEMSQWTDTYCFIGQCQSGEGGIGRRLFPPSADEAFRKSIGGMIWPRGFVAAAAYWNFQNTTDPSSPSFVAAIDRLNDQLQGRSLSTCPTNCSCDQVSACGKPYLPPPPPPPPPKVGTKIKMTDCATATRWTLMEYSAAAPLAGAFKIATAPASREQEDATIEGTVGSLCWAYDGESAAGCVDCLHLGPCETAPAFNRSASGEIFSIATKQCVDLSSSGGLGTDIRCVWN